MVLKPYRIKFMPYIKIEDRKKMDEVVDLMLRNGVEPDGKLNYVIFKFCRDYFVYKSQESYNNLKNFIGELTECAAEIRRRILSPYEDQKIEENGDV